MSAETKTPTSFLAAAQAGQLSAHPQSAIFPRMSEQELGSLGEDIVVNGLKEAMWVLESKILDGNSRYQALLKKGYRFKDTDFQLFDPKVHGDPLAFVVSRNLHRRHLTTSQRALVAARLVTTKLGFNQYNRDGVTNEKAAQLLGVSEAIVKTAKDLEQRATPEIKEKVQKGELALGAAKDLLEFPQAQQLAELNKITAQREKEKADKAAEKAKGTGTKSKADPKANQKMKDVDDFKAKWQGFDEMQRKAFVMLFEDELTGLLDYVRQQKAMTSKAA